MTHLKLAVALKVCTFQRALPEGTHTTEVAALQQAVPDIIRDESMRPPEIYCPLIIKASISPSIACSGIEQDYVLRVD